MSTFWSWRTWWRWLRTTAERSHTHTHTQLAAAGGSPEGSSLHILARQSDVGSFLQQRAKGHVLPQSPVHHPLADHLPSGLQDPAQTWKKHQQQPENVSTCPSPSDIPGRSSKSSRSEEAVSRLQLPEFPVLSRAELQTSVDGEVLHRDGRGHLSDVAEVVLGQAGGRAAHGLGLPLQGEET